MKYTTLGERNLALFDTYFKLHASEPFRGISRVVNWAYHQRLLPIPTLEDTKAACLAWEKRLAEVTQSLTKPQVSPPT